MLLRLTSILLWIALVAAALVGLVYLWLAATSLRYPERGGFALGVGLLLGMLIEVALPAVGLWLVRMGQPWSLGVGLALGALSLGLTLLLVVLVPAVAFGIGSP